MSDSNSESPSAGAGIKPRYADGYEELQADYAAFRRALRDPRLRPRDRNVIEQRMAACVRLLEALSRRGA